MSVTACLAGSTHPQGPWWLASRSLMLHGFRIKQGLCICSCLLDMARACLLTDGFLH